MNHTNSIEQRKNIFIERSAEVHEGKYDYSKVIYVRAQEKVEIICPTHGSFWQVPDSHSRGAKVGCPACGRGRCRPIGFSQRLTQENFLNQCKKEHGEVYSYDKTIYTGKMNVVSITCREHGDFEQKAENHKNGAGCPTCGIVKAHNHFRATTEEFIEKAKKIHGDLYDYSKTEYKGKSHPVLITCKVHGDFTLGMAQWHYLHMTSCTGCPKCSNSGTSMQEQELAAFVKSLELTILENDRTIIKPYEIDIVVPELKIGIEYNGLYWHSEQAGKTKTYHLDKLNKATEAGYRLIQIFENEWTHKKEIVKNRIRHILGKDNSIRLFARKLVLSKVTPKQAREFFTTHHIQGPCPARVAYGLFNDEELVACMSFGINRFTKEKGIELIRYATAHNVVGGFSKLLTYFRRENPDIKSVTSYSDKNWSVGNVYEKNGFEYVGSSSPGYFYSNSTAVRINRVSMQAHKLKDKLEIYDENLTEVQNVTKNGYWRVFDSGQDKWELKL
jgi:G:T-mismatch repair DNA endonuclease (very short patch repair protein)